MKTTAFTIDGRPVEGHPGETVHEIAGKLGIAIPTMCRREGCRPSSSCMVCVVHDRRSDRFLPSCSSLPEEGMEIETAGDEVIDARRAALELLLSDHVGDCEAPCQRSCPFHVDIPRMIRQIAAGDGAGAARTLGEKIALPRSLSYACPSPCEKACRRAAHDGALRICLLKRYAADSGGKSAPGQFGDRPSSGKKVAVIGAGPAGLTAASFLLRQGHGCTVFEKEDQPGGRLRSGPPEKRPPGEVLEEEIEILRRRGALFETNRDVGRDVGLDEIARRHDAVVIATGAAPSAGAAGQELFPGLEMTEKGLAVDRRTRATAREGIFAAGDVVRRYRLTPNAAGQGRAVAATVGRYLAGEPLTAGKRRFNSVVGSLQAGEMDEYLKGSDPSPPVHPFGGDRSSYSPDEAVREARRCLHCDCRKKDSCRLRSLSESLGAVQRRYHVRERASFRRRLEHPAIVYEPEKCIRCGLCLQAAAGAGEEFGLAFEGRGLEVRVAVPFGLSLAEGLSTSAEECVTVCPTGALSLR